MAGLLTSPAIALLVDSFARVCDGGEQVLDGLHRDELTHRVDDDANTIGWLVWHLLRVQDDHVAEVAGIQQVWTAGGFVDRADLPFEAAATGYGHSSDDVAATEVDPSLLADYSVAVHAATSTFLSGLADADLDRVVDDSWDPPVTLGARLVSVIGDDTKHLGQAELLRGLLPSRDPATADPVRQGAQRP